VPSTPGHPLKEGPLEKSHTTYQYTDTQILNFLSAIHGFESFSFDDSTTFSTDYHEDGEWRITIDGRNLREILSGLMHNRGISKEG
jgi:hypothetical protein